jgi:hypothetical protein
LTFSQKNDKLTRSLQIRTLFIKFIFWEEITMDKIDRIFRVLKPTAFLFLLGLFLGLGHLITLCVKGSGMEYDKFQASIAGIGAFLFLLYFSLDLFSVTHHRRERWQNKVASVFGVISILIGGLYSVLSLGLMTKLELSPGEAVFLNPANEILFITSFFTILCFVFMWTQYVVPFGCIVTINGKVFYPGQTYRLWPFLYYSEVMVIRGKFTTILEVATRGQVPRNITFCFDSFLDLARAQTEGKKNFYPLFVEGELYEFFKKIYNNKIIHLSGQQLIDGETDPEKIDISFPFTWNGKFTISTD